LSETELRSRKIATSVRLLQKALDIVAAVDEKAPSQSAVTQVPGDKELKSAQAAALPDNDILNNKLKPPYGTNFVYMCALPLSWYLP